MLGASYRSMHSSAKSQISRASKGSRRSNKLRFTPSPAVRQQVRKIMSDNHSNIGSENNDLSKSVDKPIFRLG